MPTVLRHTLALTALGFIVAAVAGCNNCEKLTERVCADLGDDCALWREIGGPDQITPQGRKVDSACATINATEAAYKGMLSSARGMVLAERLTRAAEKGDKAEMEKVKALLEAHKADVETNLAKMK